MTASYYDGPIVVRATALRTPLGDHVDHVIEGLRAQHVAAIENHHFPTGTYAVKLGAPVRSEVKRVGKQMRHLSRMGVHGYATAVEAAAARTTKAVPERLGVFSGSDGLRAYWDEFMPALADQVPDGTDAWRRGFGRLHPFWMLKHLSNNTHAVAAAALDARGEGAHFGGATAGIQAIGSAIDALRADVVDQAIVFAYGTLLEPETLLELGAAGHATHARVESFVGPYQPNSTGWFPGEGAGCLVLERGEGTTDAVSLAVVERTTGRSGAPLMPAIVAGAEHLFRAGDLVDGAALGAPGDDEAELGAYAGLASDQGFSLMASRGALGHLGAAHGLVQAAFLSQSLSRGLLAPLVLRAHDAPRGEPRGAVGVSWGAPGLVGLIRLELCP